MGKPEHLLDNLAGHRRASTLLKGGALVALPTETVYGLAADARNDTAVARIFAAKGRPSFNPLIVHVASLAAAENLAELSETARSLAERFWPGALTLVLPAKPGNGLSPLVTAGLPTVAIRVPAHPAMRAVLEAFGGPIAAPSANPSGAISATTADQAILGLGPALAAVLDAGPARIGLESTILAPSPASTRLLREGGIPQEDILPITGPLAADTTPGKVQAPGQLSSHYAPGTPLRLGLSGGPEAIVIGFGTTPGDITLSATGDLIEAAARLFTALHEADALAKARGADIIEVAEIPNTGLGRAINDRLTRAAAPK